MKYLSFLCFMILIISCDEHETNNWKIVFQDNLEAWEIRNGDAAFELNESVLSAKAKMNTRNTFLSSKKNYSDFILEFEVKVDPRINSGVQIRSHSIPSYYDGAVHGYQIEIDPSERAWSGGLYEESKRGWISNLEKNPKGRAAFKNGSWNHYRIEAINDSIRVWVNDINTSNTIDDMEASGFIAFQMHSIGDSSLTGAKVEWKNVRIQDSKVNMYKRIADSSVPYNRYKKQN